MMSQPNPTNNSPLVTRTCSRSTGRPPQTTEVAEPTAKPTFTTQRSCSTTSTPSHCTTRPRESTLVAGFGANFYTAVAGCNVTPCQDAVALPPPLQPHPSATTYDIFPESVSDNVANTNVEVDSADLVNAPVSPTLLSQTNPPHPSNDKDDAPNGSPGGKTSCAIYAALSNHGTAMDAVIALKAHTLDKMVASYFRIMIATLDQRLSNMQQQMTSTHQQMASTKQRLDQLLSDMQWQMATTIANSIHNALEQKITPLHDNITTLGNRLNATASDATTFASTICHKIADTLTPLRANIRMLRKCLNALKNRNYLNMTIADTTTLASTICTEMAEMVDLLRDNLTAMEARLSKHLDDLGSRINHITKTIIPDVKNKVYNHMLGTNRGQHATPPNPTPDDHGPAAPAAVVTTGQQTTQTTNDEGVPPQAPPIPPKIPDAPDFVVPAGHLGSGLGAPTTPIQSEVQGTNDTMLNVHLAHEEGHRRCLARGPPVNPYTPVCPLP
jgi:hypothetical protein